MADLLVNMGANVNAVKRTIIDNKFRFLSEI